MPPAPPAILMRLVAVLSAIVAGSAVGGAAAGFITGNYFLAVLELVVLLAAAMGVPVGLGRFNRGPAIAVACVAGGVATPTVLSYLSQAPIGPLMGLPLMPLVAGRLLAGAGLAAIAGLILILRRPAESTRLLVKGALLGAPVAIFALLYWRVPAVGAAIAGLHPIANGLLWVILGLVGLVLTSVSGHCLIRAFEVGVEAGEKAADASEKPGAAAA